MNIEDSKFDNSMRHINGQLSELLRLMKAKNRLNGETILDNQDLCMMLNLSKRTLQRYRAIGMLPYIQIGGKPFYYESDIEEFIRKNKCDKPPSKDNGT